MTEKRPRGWHKRVSPVTFSCTVCGAPRSVRPSYFKLLVGRFCSKKCSAVGTVKPDRYCPLNCTHCGRAFTKRVDHLRERNFCSPACAGAYRSAPVSKWGKNADAEGRREYQRTYREQHREHLNALAAEWCRNNRPARNRHQQLRRAGGSITQSEWDAILARHDGRCVGCGSSERVEMDHIVPVARGGLTVSENLQPLCRTCNASKGARLMKACHAIEIVEV